MDIDTDPGCCTVTDPGVVYGHSSDQMTSCPWVAALATHVYMAPVTACPSKTNMASAVSQDCEPLHGPQGNSSHGCQ